MIERNVSHLDTRGEMDRVLAGRPGAVAISMVPRTHPHNRENLALVDAYVRDNCRFIGSGRTFEVRREKDVILIFGDCRQGEPWGLPEPDRHND